jgi:hypothetical protein
MGSGHRLLRVLLMPVAVEKGDCAWHAEVIDPLGRKGATPESAPKRCRTAYPSAIAACSYNSSSSSIRKAASGRPFRRIADANLNWSRHTLFISDRDVTSLGAMDQAYCD